MHLISISYPTVVTIVSGSLALWKVWRLPTTSGTGSLSKRPLFATSCSSVVVHLFDGP